MKKQKQQEIKSDNPRQKCPKCGAVYRWPVDFEEHLRVGCRIESGKGETFSDKDVDSDSLEGLVDSLQIT